MDIQNTKKALELIKESDKWTAKINDLRSSLKIVNDKMSNGFKYSRIDIKDTQAPLFHAKLIDIRSMILAAINSAKAQRMIITNQIKEL